MRLGPEWVFLFGVGGMILALSAPPPLFAQVTGVAANPQRTAVAVPFVGCESFGQTERSEAPKGTNKSVPISPLDAEALDYYESANDIGLVAPRGWSCEGASGSSGSALFLSPTPIHHDLAGWEGLEGPAIEVQHITSENGSGMFEIAEIIARVFPKYRSVAKRFWERMGLDSASPSGPYPKDTLTYKSKTVVEYKTPAQTEGLGNFDSWLKKNETPIVGAAILIVDPPNLVGNPPNLVLLSVRLPPDLARLTPAIISYVERDAAGTARK
jgi:hypothetical protein